MYMHICIQYMYMYKYVYMCHGAIYDTYIYISICENVFIYTCKYVYVYAYTHSSLVNLYPCIYVL